MAKVAVIVLADPGTIESLGRVVNAMMAVKELQEAGDTVQLIFDGAGTKWVAELSSPDHSYGGLFRSVKGRVIGACSYCANAFGATEAVARHGLALVGDYEGHPSFRKLVSEGYQVITF